MYQNSKNTVTLTNPTSSLYLPIGAMAAGGQPTWLEKMTALIGDELPSSDDEELPVPKPIRKGLQPGRSTNARPTLNGRENCWEPRLCEYSRDNGSAFRELPAIKRVLKARERHEAACATPSSLSLTPTVRGLGTAAVAVVAQRKSTASRVVASPTIPTKGGVD